MLCSKDMWAENGREHVRFDAIETGPVENREGKIQEFHQQRSVHCWKVGVIQERVDCVDLVQTVRAGGWCGRSRALKSSAS